MLKQILARLSQPFAVILPVHILQKKFYTGYIQVPGIATGAAYASGDAVGTRFSFQVPKSGTISVATYLDRDDEGLEVDLVLFTKEFIETADNSAFAITDADLQSFLTTITFATFKNFANNQTSVAAALGLDFIAPDRSVWAQLVARGALNIAADNFPQFSLTGVSDE